MSGRPSVPGSGTSSGSAHQRGPGEGDPPHPVTGAEPEEPAATGSGSAPGPTAVAHIMVVVRGGVAVSIPSPRRPGCRPPGGAPRAGDHRGRSPGRCLQPGARLSRWFERSATAGTVLVESEACPAGAFGGVAIGDWLGLGGFLADADQPLKAAPGPLQR